jgi:hypothetical protein
MRSRLLLLFLAFSVLTVATASAAPGVKTLEKSPPGVAKKIAALLDKEGYEVSGEDKTVCRIWFVKNVNVDADFKPKLSVKYPFKPGELVGVLQVAEKSGFTDFRAAELAAGTYTLRYGQQPQDGNHIGTSATRDFLLAVPAKKDTSPEPMASADELNQKSAEASGSAHPAILSMLPVEKAGEKPQLTHDEDHDFWILTLNISVKAKDKTKDLPIRFVVIGHSDE